MATHPFVNAKNAAGDWLEPNQPVNKAVDLTKSMTQQPWYVQQMQAWGLDPNISSGQKLTEDQQATLTRLAKQHGVITDDNYQMSEYGGVVPKNHMDLATKIGILVAAGIMTWGVGSAIMAGGGAATGGAGTAGAFVDPSIDTIAAGTTGALPSTTIGTGMIPAVGGAPSGAVSAALGGHSTLSAMSDLLQMGGKAVGDATRSAGNTQLQNNDLNAQATTINNNATANYETERERLSQIEATQRGTDQTNLARASYLRNPRVSPFDPAGAPVQSPEYMQGLSEIEKQALARLKTPLTYDPANIAPTKPTPYVPNTTMSTAQKVGNVAAPALTIAGALAPYLRYL